MYPEDDLKGSEERLRVLPYRFGGPQRYIAKRVTPACACDTPPFPIDQRASRPVGYRFMDNAICRRPRRLPKSTPCSRNLS